MKTMTFIELLIALFLGSLLFLCLMTFYHATISSNLLIEKRIAFEEDIQYAYQRLTKTFSKVQGNSSRRINPIVPQEAHNHYFYSELDSQGTTSLIFTHSERTSSQSILSPTVISRLAYDPQKKQLCLFTWATDFPIGTKTENISRKGLKEVLAHNVLEAHFSFYHPKHLDTFSWGFSEKKELPEFVTLHLLIKAPEDDSTQKVVFSCPIRYASSRYSIEIKKSKES